VAYCASAAVVPTTAERWGGERCKARSVSWPASGSSCSRTWDDGRDGRVGPGRAGPAEPHRGIPTRPATVRRVSARARAKDGRGVWGLAREARACRCGHRRGGERASRRDGRLSVARVRARRPRRQMRRTGMAVPRKPTQAGPPRFSLTPSVILAAALRVSGRRTARAGSSERGPAAQAAAGGPPGGGGGGGPPSPERWHEALYEASRRESQREHRADSKGR